MPTAIVLEELRVERAAIAELALLPNFEKAARDRLLKLIDVELTQLADSLRQPTSEWPFDEASGNQPSTPSTPPAVQMAGTGPAARVQRVNKQRTRPMDRVIEMARSTCDDPNDTTEVMLALRRLAEQRPPPVPLYGPDEKGVRYDRGNDEAPAVYTKKALAGYLGRWPR